MKIKSMTATFGKLNSARLTPGPGLTLIHAPNEGGKSTWCAFWRAMLYGIDTRDRDKKGYLADKNRYQPWSGAPMAGELEVEWQGRDITIRRGPRGNTPFGAFSAVYTGTEEPVDLPKSNVIVLTLGQKGSVVLRPSGTEPKIKLYLTAVDHSREAAMALLEQLDKIMHTYLPQNA